MKQFGHDLRYAMRQMRSAPAFALTAVLTLALGIGAATAMFSVLDAVLLRPLPFAHQDRIVSVETRSQSGYSQPMSYLDYVDTRNQMTSFAAMSGYLPGNTTLQPAQGAPSVVRHIQTGDGFFEVFGIRPLLGRTFLPGEELPGRNQVVVLSYEVWQEHFGGDRNIVGRAASINGAPMTVIGVMPSGFRYPLSARRSIYTPLQIPAEWRSSRGSHWMQGVALLKPGVSRDAASAQLRHVLNNLARAYPDTDEGRTGRVVPIRESRDGGGGSRQPLMMIALATVALLGIACVNVAGLMLARGVRRQREMALRSAIGADRIRLLRQLCTEALVFASLASVAGMGVAWSLLVGIQALLAHALPRGADVHLQVEAFAVAVALSGCSSFAASLAPALRLSRVQPAAALRTGGAAGVSPGQHRLRSAFVITQVALSLVLLSVSGLLLQALQRTMQTSLGFDPDHILAVDLNLPAGEYQGRDPVANFYRPVLEKVRTLPDVAGVGLTTMLPIREWGSNSEVHIAGQPPYPPNEEKLAEQRFVSAGYMEAMGAHLLAGRPLSAALDTPDLKAGNVIVNRAFQQKFFPSGGSPVGAHTDEDPANRTAIVGEYTDLRQDLRDRPLAEMDYLIDELPLASRLDYLGGMVLVVRTHGNPKALLTPVRNALHAVDPTVPFDRAETMRQVMLDQMLFERLESRLFAIFAILAGLLCLAGIAGTMQHEVELRRREIGVRMALGASRGNVLAGVLRRTALLLAIGLAIGVALAAGAGRWIGSLVDLQGSSGTPVFLCVGAALLAAGLLASVPAARRASVLEPVEILRSE